ncbi:MAG: sugar transferase [Atopobiaceae bacterium]|nr:sugar transferase [Atopobiaceae bacterium]
MIAKRSFDGIESDRAIAIMLEDGVVAYASERLGRNMKPFRMLKYHSMIKDAESNFAIRDKQVEADLETMPKLRVLATIISYNRADMLPNAIEACRQHVQHNSDNSVPMSSRTCPCHIGGTPLIHGVALPHCPAARRPTFGIRIIEPKALSQIAPASANSHPS